MLLAPYADYEARALAYSGTDAASVADPELLRLRALAEGRVRAAWEHTWWPDTMESEERAYRDTWDAASSSYAAADEVYWAGLSAIVITGAGTSGANGTYQGVSGQGSSRPTFWLNGDTSSGYYIQYSVLNANWVLFGPGGGLYVTAGGEAYPWEASSWDVGAGDSPAPTGWEEDADTVAGAGYYQASTTPTTGKLPLIDAVWSLLDDLTPPEVAYEQTGQTAIGMVRLASADDPLGGGSPRRLPFQLTSTGVCLLGEPVPSLVYLWFQRRPPTLQGAVYSASDTYAVGDRIYFASGSGAYRGDVWQCVTATSAGESPITHAAKWSKIELPRFLLEPVAAGIAADLLRAGGRYEQAALLEQQALDLLLREHAKLDQKQLQDPGTLRSKAASRQFVPAY